MKNVLNYKIWPNGNRQSKHPTEKPEFLISVLIEVFTNPWEIVLDSFAGSGTTWVASYKKWRQAISIEREPWFVKMIKSRQLKAEQKRGK